MGGQRRRRQLQHRRSARPSHLRRARARRQAHAHRPQRDGPARPSLLPVELEPGAQLHQAARQGLPQPVPLRAAARRGDHARGRGLEQPRGGGPDRRRRPELRLALLRGHDPDTGLPRSGRVPGRVRRARRNPPPAGPRLPPWRLAVGDGRPDLPRHGVPGGLPRLDLLLRLQRRVHPPAGAQRERQFQRAGLRHRLVRRIARRGSGRQPRLHLVWHRRQRDGIDPQHRLRAGERHAAAVARGRPHLRAGAADGRLRRQRLQRPRRRRRSATAGTSATARPAAPNRAPRTPTPTPAATRCGSP